MLPICLVVWQIVQAKKQMYKAIIDIGQGHKQFSKAVVSMFLAMFHLVLAMVQITPITFRLVQLMIWINLAILWSVQADIRVDRTYQRICKVNVERNGVGKRIYQAMGQLVEALIQMLYAMAKIVEAIILLFLGPFRLIDPALQICELVLQTHKEELKIIQNNKRIGLMIYRIIFHIFFPILLILIRVCQMLILIVYIMSRTCYVKARTVLGIFRARS